MRDITPPAASAEDWADAWSAPYIPEQERSNPGSPDQKGSVSGRSDSQPDWSERTFETAFISSNLVAKSIIHSLFAVTVTFPRISSL